MGLQTSDFRSYFFTKMTTHTHTKKNKNTKVLIIYSVILIVISVISVTLTAIYQVEELDMVIFVISDFNSIRIDVLILNFRVF